MNLYGAWKFWAMLNVSFWVGFESGTPRITKGFAAGIPHFGRGCIKGLSACMFPPAGILYACDIYLNWDSTNDLT